MTAPDGVDYSLIRQAFANLPVQDQRLLQLLVADPPASSAEISKALGIPVGTIGPAKAKALRRIRELVNMPMFPVVADWTPTEWDKLTVDTLRAPPLGEPVQVTFADSRPGRLVRGHYSRGQWVRAYRVRPARKPVLSPRSLTGAAIFLAGKKRSAVRDEWRSHLSGETGRGLPLQDQVRAARGFLWSAVRYRLRDLADLAWRPADAALRSRTLSNLTVWVPLLLASLAIVRHGGFFGLVANADNLIELGGGLYGVIRVGRWWRGVKPPKHKPGRVKE